MKITARRLESQGKERYAKLFERIYPNGADSEQKPQEHQAAVIERLNVFEVRNDEVLACCEDCGKHFLIRPWVIVDALKRKRTINCPCCFEHGSLLPVFRRNE